jgi:hypothetical protein
MPRFLRYLRIAFSATFLIACVLLIVLWVRSYWWVSHAYGPITSNQMVECHSFFGQVWIGPPTYRFGDGPWDFSEEPSHAWKQPIMFLQRSTGLVIPYWLLTVIVSATAASPWIRWSNRFSLRTLLIATTLVAVVLGIVVYAASRSN